MELKRIFKNSMLGAISVLIIIVSLNVTNTISKAKENEITDLSAVKNLKVDFIEKKAKGSLKIQVN